MKEQLEFKISGIENGLLFEYEVWSKQLIREKRRRAFIYNDTLDEERVVEELCEFIKDLFRKKCQVDEEKK